MLLLQALVLAAFPLLLIVAALRDLTSFTIPNWISLVTAAAFILAAVIAKLPPVAIGYAVSVGAGALMLGMIMFALGWIGGGDAKLMAACGVWLGWSAFLPFLIATAAAGGALALLLLAFRKAKFWLPPRLPKWMHRLATPGENVPYGVAIAVGALVVFPTSPIAAAIGHVTG